MPSMMVQSAGIKRLRREMESRRRRSPELAPTGRVAKMSSTPPPLHPSPDDERSADVLAMPAPPPVPGRPATSAAAAATANEPTPTIEKGTQVSVRTRVGKISVTGHQTRHLVLRLDAVVVSADEDGFLDVVYKVGFPHDDPFRPVRVARDQVQVILQPAAEAPSVDSSTATDAAVRRAPGHDHARSRRTSVLPGRPTVAGKSLRLLTAEERKRASWSN
ncbi:hypothetical protein OsI_26127 [Oryza sativa Indica Group]|jgi:hypothetical protein|uniref:Uncharacterized protein n=1 Tax=Oryza sativa subsp. indica TaxID=39946 RepID=A2YLM8_ORYSI|nr:hypothetical protein OsI_26127 [Oryza sativa Indica Group]